MVEQASATGHAVTAFVHDPQRYSVPPGVRVADGDATDPADVSRAVTSQDAVVNTIGGKTPWRWTALEQSAGGDGGQDRDETGGRPVGRPLCGSAQPS